MSIDFAAGFPPHEQRAIAIVALMIHMHVGKDGEGLFEGKSRYQALFGRRQLAAERSRNIREFWDLASRDMRWSVGPAKYDDAILALIQPCDTDADTLNALATHPQSIIMIARQAARTERAEPTDAEIEATRVFLALEKLTVADVDNLVRVYQPDVTPTRAVDV